MKYIVKTLDLMDYLSEKLNISFDENNRYASIISKLVELKTELILSSEVREKIFSGKSISESVPHEVEKYIREKGLYNVCD